MPNNVYKYHVGIDVSKAKLDVSISNTPSIFQFSNNELGLKELVKVLPKKKQTLIIFEATGGYEKLAANYLRKKEICSCRRQCKAGQRFCKSERRTGKNRSN